MGGQAGTASGIVLTHQRYDFSRNRLHIDRAKGRHRNVSTDHDMERRPMCIDKKMLLLKYQAEAVEVYTGVRT
jgi:hypothetical protein